MNDDPDTVRLVRLVDDDTDLLAAQTQALRVAGFVAQPYASAEAALDGLTPDWPGVVLSDVRMPGMDGFAFFQRLHQMDPELPVILLTGHADVPMAVTALKQGAYDFLSKPLGADQLAAALNRACQSRALVMENRTLRRERQESFAEETRLVGQSAVMQHLRDSIARLAEAGGDLLIVGPGGSGKETVARAIHRQSPRRVRGFVHIACETLDDARFEAEFLGQEPGGRQARIAGRLEKAHRGTLYLDGIDRLAPALQARLVALIEAGEFWPMGAAAPRPLDLRVIASVGAEPERLVRDGGLRADLYYRLSGVVLQLPALADRREDMLDLFRHFMLEAGARLKLHAPPMSPAVRARLSSHDWPGNLRELRQFAEAHVLGLPAFDAPEPDTPQQGLADMVQDYESGLIREALRLAGGNATRAMERLQLPRKTFYDKLTRHGIKPADYRSPEEG
ncbi:sigma-54-dependent transcriptional regulator [Paracoccus laeviglucosivorans]|uniref:Two-component system, NtrC family, C4-dicarboxylate transport response regulator DctD n=1 Tax=Paracoccus laeviglucosivorans TaxID=1197861 RepID=A0A521F6H7_9RHOB|nr:sigma-54 dependent transcriptional regulator [Paracoccus laeviglucosivorans]SMO91694.1 two-component system, NtrC family, C4-dicarboxylate transport response regulator DctD [Paracoccus laeviglucosivorans]